MKDLTRELHWIIAVYVDDGYDAFHLLPRVVYLVSQIEIH